MIPKYSFDRFISSATSNNKIASIDFVIIYLENIEIKMNDRYFRENCIIKKRF